MVFRFRVLAHLMVFTLLTAPSRLPGASSTLFGEHGELWDPLGRLPDFSHAGYQGGNAPLPRPPVIANVRDFGARGDGRTDDTEAFRSAVARTTGGALLIPAGRYVITGLIEITHSHLVLRGEGADRSILVFPKGLEEIYPTLSETATGQPTTAFSWSGGFLRLAGRQNGKTLGRLSAPARRGTRRITLDRPPRIQPGDRIEITQEDPDGSLLDHLYQGQPDRTDGLKKVRTSFVSAVRSVEGSTLVLERPLRTDIAPRWNARVATFLPSVTEVGIEDLAFEFPSVPYRGHFKEDGFNTVAMTGAADCWIRDVRIRNADSGPYLNGGTFITVDGIVFEADRPLAGGMAGHHGITLGSDSLVTRFDFRCRFIHDITAEGHGGAVVANGRAVDLAIDHHKRYPHANLFTDIDAGEGSRLHRSGGGPGRGRHAGAWTTLWNIRARRPLEPFPSGFGPDRMTAVGLHSRSPAVLDPEGVWFEPIPPESLKPKNLHTAQKERRKNVAADEEKSDP